MYPPWPSQSLPKLGENGTQDIFSMFTFTFCFIGWKYNKQAWRERVWIQEEGQNYDIHRQLDTRDRCDKNREKTDILLSFILPSFSKFYMFFFLHFGVNSMKKDTLNFVNEWIGN